MKTEHSYSAKGVLAALGRSALYLLFFVAVQVLLPFVYGIGIAADAAINRGADLAQGAQAVAKSYPGFFEDYRGLGGRVLVGGPAGEGESCDCDTRDGEA